MTKYYCDVCGKEEKRLKEVRIPHCKGVCGSFSTLPIEVCEECKEEYDALIKILLDIRFELFEKFYKPMESQEDGVK